jgi:hypothetical protein
MDLRHMAETDDAQTDPSHKSPPENKVSMCLRADGNRWQIPALGAIILSLGQEKLNGEQTLLPAGGAAAEKRKESPERLS